MLTRGTDLTLEGDTYRETVSLEPLGITPTDSHIRQTPWSVLRDGSDSTPASNSDIIIMSVHKDMARAGAWSPACMRVHFTRGPHLTGERQTIAIDPAFCGQVAGTGGTTMAVHFPVCKFRFVPPSFQSTFQISFTLLLHYRSSAGMMP